MSMPRLLAPRSFTLARSASNSPVKKGSAVASAARKLSGAAKSSLAATNRALREQLRQAAPEDAGKMLAAAAPELLANALLSAADETEAGRELEAAIWMKPSALALAAATTIAVFGARRHKKLRRVATKVATGAAHSLVARVGRRGPAALQAALGRGNRGTAGVEPVGDAAARPGERTDA
jgi:hypothetical protein